MSPIETQKQTDRPAEQPVLPPIVERSEDIRKALDIPQEESVNWKELILKLNSTIAEPKDAENETVARTYMKLSQDRQKIALLLNGVLAYVDQSTSIAHERKVGVIRNLAQYIDAVDVYEQVNDGKVPMQTRHLPPYFAKLVETREVERIAMEATSRVLPFQYDLAQDLGVSPRKLEMDASPILSAAVQFDVKMGSLVDGSGKVRTDRAACESFLLACREKPPFSDETIKVTTFALRYLEKNQDTIRMFADSRNRKIVDISLAEALQASLVNSPIGDTMREIATAGQQFIVTRKMPDMRKFAQNIFEKKDAFSSQAVEMALAPLAKLSDEKNRETFESDAKVVMEFFMSAGDMNIPQIEERMQYKTHAQKNMILAVLDRVVGQGVDPVTNMPVDYAAAVIERIRDATFISLNPDNDLSKAVTDAVTSLIGEKKIKVREVFELYYLTQSKSSNLMIAYKTVSLLDKYGQSTLAIKLQTQIMGRLFDMATENADNIEALAVQMNMDPKELQNIKEYCKESGFQAGKDLVDQEIALAQTFPWTTAIIYMAEFGAGTAMTLVGSAAFYRRWNTSAMVQYADHSDMKTIRATFNIPESVSIDDIKASQGRVRDILHKYERLKLRFFVPFAGRGYIKEGRAEMGAIKADKPLIAEPAPDQNAPAKPVTPLEKARAGSATGTVGDVLNPASVAQDAARISPNVPSKKAPGTDADPARPDNAATPKKKLTWADRLRGKKP